MDTVTQGRVEYSISVIVPDDAPVPEKYPREYMHSVIRNNTPPAREVLFNGKFSRIITEDTGFGFRSNAIILKKAGSLKYSYCRELPHISFCLEEKEYARVSGESFQPIIQLLDEYREINGYSCRKAAIETAGMLYTVYFTEEISVKEPTGALLQHSGISGFIMQQDEIPAARNVYHYLRYTVTGFDFKTPVPDTAFVIPEGVKKFRNEEEAWRKSREAMEHGNTRFLKQNPLTEEQKHVFNGDWKKAGVYNTEMITIRYAGPPDQWENKYSFSAMEPGTDGRILTAVTTEKAELWKNYLLVEDSPGFRLYRFDPETNQVVLLVNDAIRYSKTTGEAGWELLTN